MTKNRYYAGPVSDHFDGTRFFNAGPSTDKGLGDLLRWRFTSKPEHWLPQPPIAGIVPALRVAATCVTMIGHATALIQAGGQNILTDPVWSGRASPVGFAGPRRVCPPGVAFDDLPPIDTVLLSHNHYDHLDIATLRRLVARDAPRIITPLGNDTIVRHAIPAARVDTGDWWSSFALGRGLEASIVPAQHWSSRGLRDARQALWGGFMLRSPDALVYFAGDTGYGDGAIFHRLRQRYGSPDLALLPIGAYAPRWFMAAQHTNPDEAVQIMLDLDARHALGIHWGVFPLSDEGRDTPRDDLALALAARRIAPARFIAAEPGHVCQVASV